MDTHSAKELIQEMLEEAALAIGGLLAVHDVDNEFVWQLFQSLDSIGEKYLAEAPARTAGAPVLSAGGSRKAQRHPAVSEFLTRIRRS